MLSGEIVLLKAVSWFGHAGRLPSWPTVPPRPQGFGWKKPQLELEVTWHTRTLPPSFCRRETRQS